MKKPRAYYNGNDKFIEDGIMKTMQFANPEWIAEHGVPLPDWVCEGCISDGKSEHHPDCPHKTV